MFSFSCFQRGKIKGKARWDMTKRGMTVIMAGCMLFGMTACNDNEKKDVQVELVQEVSEPSYATVTAEYGEVVNTVKLNCVYTPTEYEDLSFPASYMLVSDVYVKEGDIVSKGEVLAETELDDIRDTVEYIEYTLAMAELDLKQTKELKELDIACAKELYEYTAKSRQDTEQLQENLENIEGQYKTHLEDLEDTILINKLQLEEYKQLLQDGQLISGIAGEITYMDGELAVIDYNVIYTEEDKKMITVSGLESCYFTVEDTTYAPYITEDESLFVNYTLSGVKIQCEVKPVKMDEWDKVMYFDVVGDETFDIEMRGEILLELERKDNVLCIATDAVHTSEEGTFVYIEDNGMLSMRYVTTGLCGAELTEITEGLSEGEIVVLK